VLDEAVSLLLRGSLIFGFFGLIYLLGRLARGGVAAGSDEVVLRCSFRFRGVALVSLLMALAFAGVALADLHSNGPNGKVQGPLLVGVLMCAGWGVPFTVEAFRRRVVLNDRGLSDRGWFRTGELIPWGEIVSVKNNVKLGTFVVRGRNGRVRVWHHLDGLSLFVDACRRRLDPAVHGSAFDEAIENPIF
jgi:hypothetical protein